MRKRVVQGLLLIVLMFAFTAVVKATSASYAKEASKPTISKTSRNILIGKKYNLDINDKIAKSTYNWTSSDKKIATVDKKGIVTAKSKGQVNISCLITTPDKTEYRVTCKVTVIEPAMTFKIRNKVSALNLGQEYDLNRMMGPSSSNDKTTWTSSNPSIAKPDSMGKFVALKEGTVTITGKTLSGKSDSVTFTVVDKDGLVTNQEELDALVGSGAQLITIKTDEELTLTIKGGKHADQTLVVDAPNADIFNRGVFKSIEIKQVKGNTWYERAVGNLLNILDNDLSIVIASYASVSIEVNEDKVVLRIVNNGKIEELVVNKEADLDITGNTKEDTPLAINVPNIKIRTSVPLNLVSNAKFELEVLPGAEKTTVKAANKNTVPTIKGNVKIKVEVDGKEEEVPGIPLPTPTPAGGGSYIPPDDDDDDDLLPGEYRLRNSLSQLASVRVEFTPFGLDYTVDTEMINTLIGFLNNTTATVNRWMATTNTPKTYGGMSVIVSGDSGSLTKTVEFTSGQLNGRSFVVTVDPDDNSVTIVRNNQTYRIKKLSDRSIQITPDPSGLGLDFEFTFR